MSSRAADDIRISTFDYHELDPQHAALYQRTWQEHIDSGQGMALTEGQIQAFYEQNPEGKALLSVATHQGKWVGSIGAMATRYGKSISDTQVFYQLVDIVVDPAYQGQGIGSRVASALTAALIERDCPTYAYPNTRSSGLFLKLGYRRVREVPTRIFLPPLESILQWSDSDLTEISLSEAQPLVDQLAREPRQQNTIIKDGAYLRWRYSKIRDVNNYHFYAIHSRGGELLALIVTTLFRFSGIRFVVVLDLFVKESADLGSVFSKNIARRFPLSPGFSTIDSEYPMARLKAAIQVPTRYNPRPTLLLSLPNCDRSFEMASSCNYVTADWNGF